MKNVQNGDKIICINIPYEDKIANKFLEIGKEYTVRDFNESYRSEIRLVEVPLMVFNKECFKFKYDQSAIDPDYSKFLNGLKIDFKEKQPLDGARVLVFGYWQSYIDGTTDDDPSWCFVQRRGSEYFVVGTEYYPTSVVNIKYWVDLGLNL